MQAPIETSRVISTCILPYRCPLRNGGRETSTIHVVPEKLSKAYEEKRRGENRACEEDNPGDLTDRRTYKPHMTFLNSPWNPRTFSVPMPRVGLLTDTNHTALGHYLSLSTVHKEIYRVYRGFQCFGS